VLSFNQYIVSLFLTGPDTKTMPLLLFEMFYNNAPAKLAAIATLLMAGILALVMVTEYVASISEFA
jgi:putative spermidine/putrescine transport system permease protein